MPTQAVGIIPARYGSTRFPGKPLAALDGKPLIQHVYERARASRFLDDVVVATDDERIAQAVRGFGGEVAMTSPTHRSGTDRVAEVARQLNAQILINIQGDEPLIRPEQIDQVVECLRAHQAVPMATVMVKITRQEDVANPHVVKVVVDQDGYALYFSRSPIPYVRKTTEVVQGSGIRAHLVPSTALDARQGSCPQPPAPSPEPQTYKHIGLYGYQRYFLLQFPHLVPTPLEQAEQLEQLRALEHGYKIKALETPYDTIGVDTPDDLQRVEALLTATSLRP